MNDVEYEFVFFLIKCIFLWCKLVRIVYYFEIMVFCYYCDIFWSYFEMIFLMFELFV